MKRIFKYPLGSQQPDNLACPRDTEAKRQAARAAFDAKVRTVGYVDSVTGRRIHDPDALGVPGAGEALPPLPDSAYPPGATPLPLGVPVAGKDQP